MPLRVAYVIPYIGRPSGWRTLSAGVVRGMKECGGVEPVLVVGREDAAAVAALFPECERWVVPRTQSMSMGAARTWPFVVLTCVQVASGRSPAVDLVHSLETYPTGLVGHWLARRRRVPHVITAAGTYGVIWRQSKGDGAACARVLREAAAVCPISCGTLERMQAAFPDALRGVRRRVVLLGSEAPARIAREEAMGRKPPDSPVVLSVGAVKPRKGYHTSLRAFAKVKQCFPDARYRIVGGADDREYYRSLMRLIETERLDGVEFLGQVPAGQLRQCFREASVFLLAPQEIGLSFEGFGLVYLEAGAHGLPVVGTRSGGVPDAVRDGETGLLAEPGDVEGLAGVLLRILGDANLATRMGRANRDWAETLTWERCAGEYQEVYRQVLGGRLRGPGDVLPEIRRSTSTRHDFPTDRRTRHER